MRRLALVAWLLLPAPAYADAIPPQPPCPAGSERVVSGHEVIYCQPTTCESDAACSDGGSCEVRGVCVARITRRVATTFPAMPGDPGREVSWTDVTGPCDANGACAEGATCEAARRCGPRSPPIARGELPPARETPGASCAVGRSRASALAAVVALVTIASFAARRRRR